MIEPPFVSVLMTAFNRENFITEAIESVISSSYTNWELIIVDDNSEDNTLKIAHEFELIDKRIKVFKNEINLGDYANRNKISTYASGKYLKYLDSDDLLYPHGLRIMVESMEKWPDAAIGFSNFWGTYKGPLPAYLPSNQAYKEHFCNGGFLFVGPSGSIYRRDLFNSLGGFDPSFGVASDYEFNLRASQNHPIVCFHRDLFYWRPHENQEFNKKHQDYILLNYKISTSFLTSVDCPLDKDLSIIAYNNLKNIMARKILKHALKLKFKLVNSLMKNFNLSVLTFVFCLMPSRLRRKFQ